MPTKSELQFLPDNHMLQRAYTLAYNGFSTGVQDFSFVYVWGLEDKPQVSLGDRLTIDNYGKPVYRYFNITDPEIQLHINKTWRIILEDTDLIDVETTKNFGVSPWEMWDIIFNIDKKLEPLVPFIQPIINISRLPDGFPLTVSEYNSWSILWQAVLSELAYEEPDAYVPGTLKANTVGFSPEDYSLQYIGMKANMKIPQDMSVEGIRKIYNQAIKLSKKIEKISPDGFSGFMTSVAWLNMVTEEMLPKQIVNDITVAFIIGSIVILVSTRSILYTFLVLWSMICTVFDVLGILYFLDWKIGTNEAIMISIASGFCADFIIQPMLAMSHDSSDRSLYGKIQASLTVFSTPVTSALITTLVAACFLYPCDILLFPPFASFLLGSGVFGILHGFIVVPGLISIFSK